MWLVPSTTMVIQEEADAWEGCKGDDETCEFLLEKLKQRCLENNEFMHMGLRARSEAEEGFGSQQKMNLGKTIKHSGMCMKRRSEELMLQGRI